MTLSCKDIDKLKEVSATLLFMATCNFPFDMVKEVKIISNKCYGVLEDIINRKDSEKSEE